MQLRIGEQMRDRFRIVKTGLPQRFARSRSRGRKRKHPHPGSLDGVHRFAHQRRFPDAGTAPECNHLVTAFQNVHHRRPLFGGQLFRNNFRLGLERRVLPATRAHKIEQRDFLREHVD